MKLLLPENIYQMERLGDCINIEEQLLKAKLNGEFLP